MVTIRGTSSPSEVWDVTGKGAYNFAGSALYQGLYTNYKITGKSSYVVTVENKTDYDLHVKVKTFWKTFSRKNISEQYCYIYSDGYEGNNRGIYVF